MRRGRPNIWNLVTDRRALRTWCSLRSLFSCPRRGLDLVVSHTGMVVLMFMLNLLSGCASPTATRGGASTLITIEDIDEVVEQMAARLASSSFMAQRSTSSEPISLTLTKPVNYTHDVIRDGDRWTLIQNVVNSPTMQAMTRERNVKLIISREFFDELKRNSADARDMTIDRRPTHVMDATLRTITRSGGDARTDQYECTYAISALGSGEVVWQDVFKIKRLAYGVQYN